MDKNHSATVTVKKIIVLLAIASIGMFSGTGSVKAIGPSAETNYQGTPFGGLITYDTQCECNIYYIGTPGVGINDYKIKLNDYVSHAELELLVSDPGWSKLFIYFPLRARMFTLGTYTKGTICMKGQYPYCKDDGVDGYINRGPGAAGSGKEIQI